MTNMALTPLAEEELDTLVSIAISRAEVLDDMQSPAAVDAWAEVMAYEERLSAITSPAEITGGIARVGAVRAALAAGQRSEASHLAAQYLAESALPDERRTAIERVFQQDQDSRARRFPALAKGGRLAELDKWRATASGRPRVFPLAA
jgi:hypothetical protein